MTSLDIITTYQNELEIIGEKGIKWYKDYINEKKNNLPISTLTIASSIIAIYDMLEKY